MKFVNKFSIISSTLVIVISILCRIEIKESRWSTEQSVVLVGTVEEVFRFVTNVDYMEKWMSFVSFIRPADSRPIGLDKKYFAMFEVPIYGNVRMLFNTTKYDHQRLIVFETDSFLRTRVEFSFHAIKQGESRVRATVSHFSPNLVLQYTVVPVANLVTYQQLQYSLFGLRLVFPR